MTRCGFVRRVEIGGVLDEFSEGRVVGGRGELHCGDSVVDSLKKVNRLLEERFDVFELTFQAFLGISGTADEFGFGHLVPATFDQATVEVVGGESVADDLVDGFSLRTLITVVIEFKVPEEVFQDDSGTLNPFFGFHCGDSVGDSLKKVKRKICCDGG